MKTDFLTNRDGWFKISLVLSVVWLGSAYIIISSSHRLQWSKMTGVGNYEAGNGFWLFLWGEIIVLVVFNGVPWIAKTFKEY